MMPLRKPPSLAKEGRGKSVEDIALMAALGGACAVPVERRASNGFIMPIYPLNSLTSSIPPIGNECLLRAARLCEMQCSATGPGLSASCRHPVGEKRHGS